METQTLSIRTLGAVGDGSADDTAAFERALSSGAREIRVPAGAYRITRTLRIASGTHLAADADARIFLCGETSKKRGDFLLTNANTETGDRDISVTGGIWDGNNTGRLNTKDSDLFRKDAWSGSVLNFQRVKGLRLEGFTVANSVVYNIRMGGIEDFHIRDIGFFSAVKGRNQDGLHFGGYVRRGKIENIRALTKGQTNDDLLALNADDSLARLENFDLERGPIEDLEFSNIFAEDCHAAVRLLSVTSPIRNIRFRNIRAGCRAYAVNMDASRYCMTPLFRDSECPQGVGCVENIEFDGFSVWSTLGSTPSLIDCECRVRNFVIRNYSREESPDKTSRTPDFSCMHIPGLRIVAERGGKRVLETSPDPEKRFFVEPSFDFLRLES